MQGPERRETRAAEVHTDGDGGGFLERPSWSVLYLEVRWVPLVPAANRNYLCCHCLFCQGSFFCCHVYDCRLKSGELTYTQIGQ